MKKIVLFNMLVVSSSLFSFDYGIITGFQLLYNVYDMTYYERQTIEDFNDSFNIILTTGYRIGNLKIIGNYENTLNKLAIDRFQPVQDRYIIDVSYTFNNLSIGFYHWCDHPVVATLDKRTSFVNSTKRSFYLKYYKEF